VKLRKPRVASEMLDKKLQEKKKNDFFREVESVMQDTATTP